MDALIIYWSATGNTKKVADTIHNALKNGGINPVLKTVGEAKDDDLFEYDLVFIGAPSYMWQPPEPVQKYVKGKMEYYMKRGVIKPCAPKVPGKKAVVFITYSGPHTGTKEAIPAGKYLGQFLEHLGIEVADEWYIVGEFHGSEENSTKGALGDIRGRPNQQDLDKVTADVNELLGAVKK
jgi:flavodoxin